MKDFSSITLNRYISFFISCAIIIFALPGQSMGFCAFTEPILATTGLSRNMFSIIYMCSTILGCFGVLISSKLVDRFGIKRSLLITLPLWICTLICFGSCSRFHSLVQNIIPDTIFYVIFFTSLIFILRFLGQNMLPLLGRMQIVRIFTNKQGLAIASCGLFVSICNGITPSFMRWLTPGNDWQHTFCILSISGIALFMVVLVFLKNNHVATVQTNSNLKPNELHITFYSRKNLLKMPVFWCITSALCLNAFIGSGTVVHIVDIFREKNVSESIALSSYIPLCIVTTIAGFIFGKLVDCNYIKLSILLMFLAQFLGLTGITLAEYKVCIILYIVSIGSTWGGYGVLLTAAWSKIFGQQHIGNILGLVYFLATITGAISVPLMSFFKYIFGSYSILLTVIRLIIIACAIFCIQKFPKKII